MLGRKYLDLAWLMRNERRPREEIVALQTRKLQRLVQHAYENVPFYRTMFQRARVRPGQIQSLQDLQRLPIIDKRDLHAWEPELLIDQRIQDRTKLISISTSGSSGRSLQFYVSQRYEQFRKAQYLRPYLSNGRRLTDTVLSITSSPSLGVRWFHRLGLLQEHRIHPRADTRQQLQRFQEIQPDILQGFPSCLVLLAKTFGEEQVNVSPPRWIFTDSELLTTEQRRIIEETFNSQILDVYGTFETENIAFECPERRGYHITEDTVIMEFIKDGAPARPQEPAEVVCTVLDNHAMPFIRYNLHDMAAHTDVPCPCGRTFPLMTVLAGRADDHLVGPNGVRHSPREVLDLFDTLADVVYEYQIRQKARSLFEILVVPSRSFDPEQQGRIHDVGARAFPGAEVRVRLVADIPRSPSSKHQALVSEVVG